MKKNLMSVLILALVFANFVLTAILLLAVLPQTKKANQMIEEVCNAIDLELNSGAATGVSNLPLSQIETFKINGGEAMTMSFAAGADGKTHYIVAEVSVNMNNKSDGYKTYGAEGLSAKEDLIKSNISKIVHTYQMSEFNDNPQAMYDEIHKDLQKMFGGDFIVGVNFSEVRTE